MGRLRKRFNDKARQSTNQPVLEKPDEKEKVVVDIDVQVEKYDSSNPLVLCKKKKESSKFSKLPVELKKKPLSKKQKKKYANILAKKKKKQNRAELLQNLSKVQAKPEELDLLKSTASMQTQGFKKLSKKNKTSKNKRSRTDSTDNDTDLHPEKKSKIDTINFLHDENFSDFDEGSDSQQKESENEESDEDDFSDEENLQDQEDFAGERKLQNNNDSPIKEKLQGQQDSICEEKIESSAECISKDELVPETCTDKKDKQDVDSMLQGDTDKTSVTGSKTPAVFVTLDRKPEIQAAREALPIFCEEQSIMEAIRENPVVIIHGETGSGKTTQVPQFLYEGGYTLNNKIIGITEPRRIAAMTMAARVGAEMNLPDVVAYHVRYENNVKEETRVKFMTDGVLVKEIRHDFFLSKYSVIIIDEAHERSVFSDVLIGLLSRIVPLRMKRGDPLKLIIMSATLRIEDFTDNPRLFKDPPFLIRLESRQYKVQVHFSITTPTNYLESAYHKVCKIHSRLPPGAILVFLTGEKEVIDLCKMLRNTFPFKDNSNYESENLKSIETDQHDKKKKKNKKKDLDDNSFCSLPPKINLDDYSVEPLDTDLQDDLSDEEESPSSVSVQKQEDVTPLYTLPLYSILPFAEQEKVFLPPPPGTRLCVVSTNVAETSITIPGLKYVVDSGKVKTKVYDRSGGISQHCITWTSKASANQRAGRAGRTEGGHCYRLYSSSVFEHEFLDFSPPEIQRIPVDDVLLQMKALGIDRVVNFPFPSPPDSDALKTAERRLVLLGALTDLNKGERYKDIKKWEFSAKITPLGNAMSRFPLSPRYSKMLILSYKHECIEPIIAIVSAMTVPQVFLNSSTNDGIESSEVKGGVGKIKAGTGKSLQLGDAMVLLRAVALYEESKNKVQFCVKNGIRHKAMVEIHKMCIQLCREMNRAFKDLSLEFILKPPSEELTEKIRKILANGFTDHVARLIPEEEMKLNKDLKNAYKCLDLEEPVFIHPSSVLFSELPRYIIFQEIVFTSKYYMKGIIEINPEWLPAFAPALCTFSEPLEEPAPSYDREKDQILCTMNVTFGPCQWELPPVMKDMPKSLLKYSWFAFFFLDGQIHEFFKKLRPHLLSSPSTILKSWAKLLPRTRYLLQALIEKEVDSKKSLLSVWEKEPKYLLREYWEWLPQEKHMEIECKWPPV